VDPYKPTYTTNNLVTQIPGGVSEGLLQNWIARGVLKLRDIGPGRGKIRTYSFYEALKVLIISQLTSGGEPSRLASAIADIGADFMCDWLAKGNSPEEPVSKDYFVMVFERGKGKKLHWKIMKMANFDPTRIGRVFTFLDLHYLTWRLYESLECGREDRVYPTKSRAELDAWGLINPNTPKEELEKWGITDDE